MIRRLTTNLGMTVLMLVLMLMNADPVFAASISVVPNALTQTGPGGTVVSYTLTVTNNDAVNPVTLSVAAASINSWSLSLNPASLTIPASGSDTVTVYVSIPSGGSTNDVETVTFSEGGGAVASITLTTSVTTPAPTTYVRPMVLVESYSADQNYIEPGADFNLTLTLHNLSSSQAANIMVSFEGESFLPQQTGGVIAVATINGGGSVQVSQPMLASPALLGQSVGTLVVKLAYTDRSGSPFSESFTLAINLALPRSMWAGYPTLTPTPSLRAQMVVSGYSSDVDPLQPGTIFNLKLDIKNLGSSKANAVSLVLGGGGSVPDASGTPQPGGVSGGSSDLTNFAPMGSSNIVFIGDVQPGTELNQTTKLIVNTTTNPGAYPLKLSFVYTDSRGVRMVDDQVITLLVYALPQLEINFYRDPGMLYTGSMNSLPLQVTNLGKRTAVLGNMTVTSTGGDVTNGVALVGNLEPGGYFTQDAMFMPYQAGEGTLTVTIKYNDDFNQERTFQKDIKVTVSEAMLEPTPDVTKGGGGGGGGSAPETFWAGVLCFLKGLFGLDSASPSSSTVNAEPTSAPIIVGPVKGP